MNYFKISNQEQVALNQLADTFKYSNTEIPTLTNFNKFIDFEDYIKRKMIKFVDNDGSVQVLNFDCTLTLAQLFSEKKALLNDNFRVSYLSKSTFINASRMMDEALIWGAENYGTNQEASDLEIIKLSIQSLLSLGVKDFTLDLGSVAFIQAMISDLKLENENKIILLIEEKNTSELKDYLKSMDCEQELMDKILKIPTLFGPFQTTVDKAKVIAAKNDEALAEIEKLITLYKGLEAVGYQTCITLDMGFTNSYQYYSGLIFKGYTNDLGKVLLQGGRYDALLTQLKSDLTACGFSIDLNKISEVKSNDKYWCEQRKSC